MTPGAPARWRTMVMDSLGLIAAVWSIPLAIILAGIPVVLLFLGARMLARMIW
jgi:hypothetical protein